MGEELRKDKGMRERSPGVWEIYAQAGKDPVTGKYRQVSKVFTGGLREARAACAEFLVEVGKGRHTGTSAKLDDLCAEWLIELKRLDRSPSTIHNYQKHYRHDIAPTLGRTPVVKVTTKMLTDLYGKHQARGLAPATVYQIHATVSAMMTQACMWGWRESNPARYARTPSIPNEVRVVPTPEEVSDLIRMAKLSRRPEYAKVIFLAATSGMRRGEICAMRLSRNVDWDGQVFEVNRNLIQLNGQPLQEALTKNRRARTVAAGEFSLELMRSHVEWMRWRAAEAGTELIEDAYVFSDAADGRTPWKPDTVTQYFGRLRDRLGFDHLEFRTLRRFMDTYGQELGFSLAQVALRAGHDPAVAAKHYTGRVSESDRALADALSSLLQGIEQPEGEIPG